MGQKNPKGKYYVKIFLFLKCTDITDKKIRIQVVLNKFNSAHP